MAKELRKTILEADDIESEIVNVPQWGVDVKVVGMSGYERAVFMKSMATEGEPDFVKWFPQIIIATAHDPEDGSKLFEPSDRDALNKKSGAAISRLADVAMRLSGLNDGAVEAAKEDFGGTPKSTPGSH